MYETEDLVQYNADGTVSFVGRTDEQVRLHGQRGWNRVTSNIISRAVLFILPLMV
ncbi:hypothetical protein BDW75DRAFT_212531 [Aspergillus navahoensis]